MPPGQCLSPGENQTTSPGRISSIGPPSRRGSASDHWNGILVNQAAGSLWRPFGTVVYLTPAFTIAPDELAALTDAVVRVVGTMEHP